MNKKTRSIISILTAVSLIVGVGAVSGSTNAAKKAVLKTKTMKLAPGQSKKIGTAGPY